MTRRELEAKLNEILPGCLVDWSIHSDNYGQVIIYTGKFVNPNAGPDAPLLDEPVEESEEEYMPSYVSRPDV